ncbi:MAG: PadR family transcriptional regulator [Terriglobales bacterium]
MANELEKRGAAEVLILALLEARPRHGYELALLIEQRSGGAVDFHAASLYPLLYRLERRGLLAARWVEKAGERRRRFYRLTAAGRKALAAERQSWQRYLDAMQALLRPEGI